MPLPFIVAINPGDDELNQWAFNHWQDHLEILQAIRKQRGVNLESLAIWPINWNDPKNFLEAHQVMHNDMNGVLRLVGDDLSVVNFVNDDQRNAWIYLNGQEHRAARGVLA